MQAGVRVLFLTFLDCYQDDRTMAELETPSLLTQSQRCIPPAPIDISTGTGPNRHRQTRAIQRNIEYYSAVLFVLHICASNYEKDRREKMEKFWINTCQILEFQQSGGRNKAGACILLNTLTGGPWTLSKVDLSKR